MTTDQVCSLSWGQLQPSWWLWPFRLRNSLLTLLSLPLFSPNTLLNRGTNKNKSPYPKSWHLPGWRREMAVGGRWLSGGARVSMRSLQLSSFTNWATESRRNSQQNKTREVNSCYWAPATIFLDVFQRALQRISFSKKEEHFCEARRLFTFRATGIILQGLVSIALLCNLGWGSYTAFPAGWKASATIGYFGARAPVRDRVKETAPRKRWEGRKKQGTENMKQERYEREKKWKKHEENRRAPNSKKMAMKLPCLTGTDRSFNFTQDVLQVE